MKPGGGQKKGASFERATCRTISLWVSNDQRPDLFSRNVLSGGRFTIAAKTGEQFGGLPGDIVASHPLAYSFVSTLSVECKHGTQPDLHKYLTDTKGTSFLAKTYLRARAQALSAGLEAIVVAKLNRAPTIVLMDYHVGLCAIAASEGRLVRWHALHSNTVMMTLLDDLVSQVNPSVFLASVSSILK